MATDTPAEPSAADAVLEVVWRNAGRLVMRSGHVSANHEIRAAVARVADEARAGEREACARLAEHHRVFVYNDPDDYTALARSVTPFAGLIRARTTPDLDADPVRPSLAAILTAPHAHYFRQTTAGLVCACGETVTT